MRNTRLSCSFKKKILKYAIRKSLLKYFNLFLLGKGRKREKNNSADKKQLIQSTEKAPGEQILTLKRMSSQAPLLVSLLILIMMKKGDRDPAETNTVRA